MSLLPPHTHTHTFVHFYLITDLCMDYNDTRLKNEVCVCTLQWSNIHLIVNCVGCIVIWPPNQLSRLTWLTGDGQTVEIISVGSTTLTNSLRCAVLRIFMKRAN